MESFCLKAKTREEVACEYGVSARTFYRWLKRDNLLLPRGLIKPFHLQIIYSNYGIPQKQTLGKKS
jgi:hypothetical protein